MVMVHNHFDNLYLGYCSFLMAEVFDGINASRNSLRGNKFVGRSIISFLLSSSVRKFLFNSLTGCETLKTNTTKNYNTLLYGLVFLPFVSGSKSAIPSNGRSDSSEAADVVG